MNRLPTTCPPSRSAISHGSAWLLCLALGTGTCVACDGEEPGQGQGNGAAFVPALTGGYGGTGAGATGAAGVGLAGTAGVGGVAGSPVAGAGAAGAAGLGGTSGTITGGAGASGGAAGAAGIAAGSGGASGAGGDLDAGPETGGTGGDPDAGPTAVDSGSGESCPLPASFEWTSGPPLAEPMNGWVSMKDFTYVFHDNKHVVYMTGNDGTNWRSGMFAFGDWADAATAPQTPTSFGVAPTLFYFSPKDIWVIAYQWGRYKFSYRTSSNPLDPNSWGAEQSLYNTALPPSGTGPIDQTVICNGARCYLYYAGDNGHIYKSSMPIDDFPSEFPGAVDSGIQGTTQNLFEGVQVYKVKGSDEYLMLVEAQGAGRFFRAWTATDLEGPWNLLTDAFASSGNVTFSPSAWTRDISHGDLVRSNPDETFTIDACNLQMLFQGRDPNINTSYGRLPYRPGLLTLVEQ